MAAEDYSSSTAPTESLRLFKTVAKNIVTMVKARSDRNVSRLSHETKPATTTGNHEEEEFDPTSPYTCTGNFSTDFRELCRRLQLAVIPPVVMRPCPRPEPPVPVVVEERVKPSKSGKNSVAVVPPPEPDPAQTLAEPAEPPPKTYVVKENSFEYLKPCVQVVTESLDKFDTVSEMYIRGWKVDEAMLNLLKQCCVTMTKLHTINLWNAGLTHDTLLQLSCFLPECTALKTLILDNNPVASEAWYLLISDRSPVQNLSLRYNKITDVMVKHLSGQLGTLEIQNQKLLTLNLTGNQITDSGAGFLACSLRWNRTLLWLSLGNNFIGDAGAQLLAEVVSSFRLNHEETVARRRIICAHPERKSSSPALNRRSESHERDRERPGSVRSGSNVAVTKGKAVTVKQKKDSRGAVPKEEEKHEKGKGKARDSSSDSKLTKKASGSSVAEKPGSKKVTAQEKAGSKARRTTNTVPEAENVPTESSPTEIANPEDLLSPLMESVEHVGNGELNIKGNWSLVCLNLSGNFIGDLGVLAFLGAVNYQSTVSQNPAMKGTGSGLLRLNLERNKMIQDACALKQLMEKMTTKDPVSKAGTSERGDSKHEL